MEKKLRVSSCHSKPIMNYSMKMHINSIQKEIDGYKSYIVMCNYIGCSNLLIVTCIAILTTIIVMPNMLQEPIGTSHSYGYYITIGCYSLYIIIFVGIITKWIRTVSDYNKKIYKREIYIEMFEKRRMMV